MSNTKFGKKILGILIAVMLLFGFVGCGETEDQKSIREITANVEDIYGRIFWDSSAMKEITSDLKGFITNTAYENVKVSWSSTQPDVISETGQVTRPLFDDPRAVVSKEAVVAEDGTVLEAEERVIEVTITARIVGTAVWGESQSQEVVKTKEFHFTVKTVPDNTDTGTIEDVKARAATYIYDEKGVQRDLVSNSSIVYNAMVDGVVTAILQADGSGQFMIHDGTEGIYVYSAPDGLKVGDQVSVVGEIYSYYGNLQFGSNITVTINSSGAEIPGTYREVTPQELEDEGAATNDKGLVKAGYLGGELVNIYGRLIKEKASAGSGEYHVADPYTGEQVWIYYKSYSAEMKALLETYIGEYVYLRGVTYDRDSRIVKCEVLWDGTIVAAPEPTLTDEQKVAVELATLTINEEVMEDFTLPTVAEGATVVWEVIPDDATAIVIENGTAKVTRGEDDVTVTLKATVTIGTASDSREFEVKVPSAKIVVITIAEALELAKTGGSSYTADKYVVRGEIISAPHATFGNTTIKDETGELYIYGLYSMDGSTRYDEMESAPTLGDIITVSGVLGTFKDSPQMKNGWVLESYDVVTIPDAITLCGTEHNVYTNAKYAVKGTIKEIQNTKYGNMIITDEDGNELLIYGTYSIDGKVRYDALEYAPQVGESVVVYGILGSYNNTPQMKNGGFVEVINPLTVERALAMCSEDGTYTENLYYVKAIVKSINNDTFGNLTLVSEKGTELATYGLYSADGSVRFDKLPVQPKVGETIIIRGQLGSYVRDGVLQAKQIRNPQLVLIIPSTKTDEELAQEAIDALEVPTTLSEVVKLSDTATWTVKIDESSAVTLVGNTLTPVFGSAAATVVLTATVTFGETTLTKDFSLTVPASGSSAVLVATDDFTGSNLSTTYNNETAATYGSGDKLWSVIYGAVSSSATGGINPPTLQIRWYTKAATTYGNATMTYSVANVSSVKFSAASTNGLKVTVSHSLDGGTSWSAGKLYDLTTSAAEYEYDVETFSASLSNSVMLRFTLTLPEKAPTDTSRVSIDDIKFYGVASQN